MAGLKLDRDRIVDAALDLLDDVGLDKLSTRALAERLGVQSPALYWHFKNKSELIAAMAEAMSLQLPGPDDEPGRRPSRRRAAELVVARAQAFRRSLLSRRDGARVHAGSRPPDSRFGSVEKQLDLLVRAGLDPVAAGRATLAVSRFVVGWVLEEQADVAAEPPADLDDYPLLARAVSQFVGGGSDADFDACLTAVVAGLVGAAAVT